MPQPETPDQLERRARTIVEEHGGVWRHGRGMCCCPAHDDRTPSLSVTLGRRAILFHCFAGCSRGDVMLALDREGIRTRELFDSSAARPANLMPREVLSRSARRLWRTGSRVEGGPVQAYLANRSLQVSSSQLRFLARTPLGPAGAVRFLPAMLAAVTTDAGLVGVHRTFLDVPNGKLAPFDRPKRVLGSLGCGAVRLAPPASGRLGLAEGVESALSATQLFGVPCWATLGNERFGLVALPESVQELLLFLDHDAGGARAEERARAAYTAAGRAIHVYAPATQGFDWNDELRSMSVGQEEARPLEG